MLHWLAPDSYRCRCLPRSSPLSLRYDTLFVVLAVRYLFRCQISCHHLPSQCCTSSPRIYHTVNLDSSLPRIMSADHDVCRARQHTAYPKELWSGSWGVWLIALLDVLVWLAYIRCNLRNSKEQRASAADKLRWSRSGVNGSLCLMIDEGGSQIELTTNVEPWSSLEPSFLAHNLQRHRLHFATRRSFALGRPPGTCAHRHTPRCS